MLSIKTKKFKSFLAAGLVLTFVVANLFFGSFTNKASAFDIPVCTPPAVGVGTGAPGLCFNSDGKTYYPVLDNPDHNTNPEDGHCYTTKASGFGFYYSNAGSSPKYGCDQAPFSTVDVFRCNDGTNIVADKKTTNGKTVCESNGGLNGQNGLSSDCNAAVLSKDNCKIIWYLQLLINTLSGLVGIVIVITIIVAGIQWTTAGSNPQQIAHAKTRIFNSLIALLLFIFMYAFLQWVVPGGVF